MGPKRGETPRGKSASSKKPITGFFTQSGPGQSDRAANRRDALRAAPSASSSPSAAAQGPAPETTGMQTSPHAHAHTSSPGGLSSSPGPSASMEGDWDWKAHLRSLPTRQDLETSVQRLERAYKAELQTLREDLQMVSSDIMGLQGTCEDLSSRADKQQSIIDTHSSQIQTLFLLQDDAENRSRRNNIRVRGLPESIGTADLPHTVHKIFISVLGAPEDMDLEIDRVHRALGPRNPDPTKPRDVLCRIHFYRTKEDIMRKARINGKVEYQGHPLQLLSDLSKHTLDQRRALRPLLIALRERKISYRWGFPFQLLVRHEGKTHVFKNPADLPHLITSLQLPEVTLAEWPKYPMGAPDRIFPPRMAPSSY